MLTCCDWPGNVLDLANVLERTQILAEGSVITVDDLPENFVQATPAPHPAATLESPFDLEAVESR